MEGDSERVLTGGERDALLSLVTAVSVALDNDLQDTTDLSRLYGPFQLLLRDIVRVAVQFGTAHDMQVTARQARELLDSGKLDPEGLASMPQAADVTRRVLDALEAKSVDTHDMYAWSGREIMQDVIADALDTAWKAAIGAPPSEGSKFA